VTYGGVPHYAEWLNSYAFLINVNNPDEMELFVYNQIKDAVIRVCNKFHQHAMLAVYNDE
jgi:ribosome biogenesis protein Nip4